MKILKDLAVEIPDTNSYHWNFEEFEIDDGNHLAVGYNSLAVQSYDNYRGHDGSRVALFNNWAPCEYAQRNLRAGVDALHLEDKFDYIFTICPFTADWRNKNADIKRYVYAFYPYSPGIIPDRREKKYDVIYHGGIHGKEHVMAIKVLMETNYRYLSLDYGINPLTRRFLRFATDINLPFKEKIGRIAESKISICFNLIHVSLRHYRNMMAYRSKLSHGGEFFDSLSPLGLLNNYPWVGVLPQFKTRVHEAAIARCVNLVYRDQWNVIEDYYEEGKEFIYFNSESDLREKISYVLANWDSRRVQDMLDAAYTKAGRYTSSNFIQKYSGVLASPFPANEACFKDAAFWQ